MQNKAKLMWNSRMQPEPIAAGCQINLKDFMSGAALNKKLKARAFNKAEFLNSSGKIPCHRGLKHLPIQETG